MQVPPPQDTTAQTPPQPNLMNPSVVPRSTSTASQQLTSDSDTPQDTTPNSKHSTATTAFLPTTGEAITAVRPTPALPSWLEPFSTPLPVESIVGSQRKTIFTGLTAVLALPVIYGSLAGLTGFALWYHFSFNKHLLDGPVAIMTFFGPIVGGFVLLAFFLAPFLLRRQRLQTSYPLEKSENPAIFALVDAVANYVGAPEPTRINASLANEIRVSKGEDDKTEVTLGLPLVAVLTIRQSAGFLAHEFYQHSSQPNARCWSFADTIRGLFARAAYDSGDVEREIVAWGGSGRCPASVTFGFIPWLFERAAAIVSDTMTSNMVFNSDRCQMRVSGSNTFAMTQLDRQLLDQIASMSKDGFAAAQAAGQRIENLPAFYANKLRILKTAQPEFVKGVCQDLMEQADADPSMGDRIALARQYQDEGIFPVDKPSAALFQNFTELCRRITAKHYETHFAAKTASLEVPTSNNVPAVNASFSDLQNASPRRFPAERETTFAAQLISPAATPAPLVTVAPDANPSPDKKPTPTPTPLNSPMSAPQTPETPTPNQPVGVPASPAIPSAAAIPTVRNADPATNWMSEPTPVKPIAPRPVASVQPAPAEFTAQPGTNSDRHHLKCFLQTDALTKNHELFLPLKEMSAAKQPEQAARMLKSARERYELVHVARKPELEALSKGVMRHKSLQLARTLSLVGLPINAEPLGLLEATNAAAANACQEQAAELEKIRSQLQELRDQAALRFIIVTQLAATPEIAKTIGVQASEIQAARLAITCLATLKSNWTSILELGRQSRQLRCLVFNLPGNEHVEALTTSLGLTSSELADTIRQILVHVPKIAQVGQAFGITSPKGSPPDASNSQGLLKQAQELLEYVERLYERCFTILACLGEKVEQHFGNEPLPEPKTVKAKEKEIPAAIQT